MIKLLNIYFDETSGSFKFLRGLLKKKLPLEYFESDPKCLSCFDFFKNADLKAGFSVLLYILSEV